MLSTFVPGQKYSIVSTILLVTAESLLAFPLAPRIHNTGSQHHHNHANLRRSSIGTGHGMVGSKRKYVSDGVDVLESFEALQGDRPEDVHTLILGTLPSDKSYGQNLTPREIRLRGGEGHQNYGHSRNSFWHIVGSAFGFLRHETPFAQQVTFLTQAGYSVWDVLSEAKRKGSLDANLVKGSLTPTDLPKFLLEHPHLNRFVFAANSAEVFCKPDVWGDWLAKGEATTHTTTGTDDALGETCVPTKFWMQGRDLNPETFARTNAIFGKKKAVEVVDDPALSKAYRKLCTIANDEEEENDSLFLTPDGTSPSTTSRRLVELIVMPSTSPANARMRPPEKEKSWHKACYRLREPPEHYVCPGCEYHSQKASSSSNNIKDELLERHWFHDCPYREDWKLAKKQQSKKKSDDDDEIDPFYWYT